MNRRALTLDRAHVVAMLQDEQFFIAVPAFFYLRLSIQAATAAAMSHTEDCESCGDSWKHYRPVVDAFILKLQELIAERSSTLEKIRAYLIQKKRYDIPRVHIYYRASGRGKILKLTF